MSAANVERFLAALYCDPEARARFLADPRAEAERAGLDPQEADAAAAIDGEGLEFAAHSFAHKRRSMPRRRVRGFLARIRARMAR